MKKLRVYIDTSVVGGCYDDAFSLDSRALLRMAADGAIVLLLSDLLIAELERAPAEIRSVLQDLPDDAIEVVEQDPESEALLPFVHNFLTMPLNYGIDVIREACEEWREQHHPDELSLEDCEHLEN